MNSLTVALLQLRSPGVDPGRALCEGEKACREAARLGADIALFPEMWQIGYAWSDDLEVARKVYTAHTTREDGPFVGHFCELAKELEIAIVITYLQQWDKGPRNAATVIDRQGRRILTYAKVHTCDFSLEAALEPGSNFPVTDLDVKDGSVRIGLMICYDREFPESARVLMLGGAEIILTPNSCRLDDDRIGQFRARAFENMVGMAMANYAAPNPSRVDDPDACNGHSVAFSGIVYGGEHGSALDHKLIEASSSEGLFLATFDLDALRAYRKRETWGDAYRKPHAYDAIVANAPAAIFARPDSRR
ncbi:MAG: carbon-nitrogen hydrolase family protein [Gaiellaceae bacterium]|jgi:predicted amidohydrolase